MQRFYGAQLRAENTGTDHPFNVYVLMYKIVLVRTFCTVQYTSVKSIGNRNVVRTLR